MNKKAVETGAKAVKNLAGSKSGRKVLKKAGKAAGKAGSKVVELKLISRFAKTSGKLAGGIAGVQALKSGSKFARRLAKAQIRKKKDEDRDQLREMGAQTKLQWKDIQLGIKRGFDIAAASLMIAVLTLIPVMIIIPVLIRLESKGSPIFKQERMGKDRQRFMIYKFRTMRNPPEGTYSVDGILYKPNGELLEPSSTRITKVGAFLRKTSLDELPQLFNIVNGTMSFVGPRPTLPYQAESYNEEQLRRFEVRPGVTGLAQVSGRNDLTWTEKIAYDVEYIDSFSLWTDIKILFKTVAVVLKKDDIEFTKEDSLTAKPAQAPAAAESTEEAEGAAEE